MTHSSRSLIFFSDSEFKMKKRVWFFFVFQKLTNRRNRGFLGRDGHLPKHGRDFTGWAIRRKLFQVNQVQLLVKQQLRSGSAVAEGHGGQRFFPRPARDDSAAAVGVQEPHDSLCWGPGCCCCCWGAPSRPRGVSPVCVLAELPRTPTPVTRWAFGC